MKVLVIADVECPQLWERFDRSLVEGVDLVVSCGDLKPAYLTFLVTMIPVPLFYVLGNHDRDIKPGQLDGCVNLDGKLINYKGVRFMGLGGVRSAAPMAQHFTEQKMSRRIQKLRWDLWKNKGFDVLVTHSPPLGLGDGQDSYHQGFECFRNLIDVYKPALCLPGHPHLSYAPRSKRINRYRGPRVINGFRYRIVEIEPGRPEPVSVIADPSAPE